MSEDAGAGTADAASTETTGTQAGTAADQGTDGAEELLAEAVEAGTAADDAAEQLARTQAEVKKWRDMSRKNEARVKELTPAAAKLAEIEEANKTETQKSADRATAAELRAAAAEAKLHRATAAATHGLPASLIELLGGATEDEINAGAETIAAEIAAQVAEQVATAKEALAAAAGGTTNGTQHSPRGAQRPVEAMRAGAAPAGTTPQTGSEWVRGLLTS